MRKERANKRNVDADYLNLEDVTVCRYERNMADRESVASCFFI
jgi:hypothetical protein